MFESSFVFSWSLNAVSRFFLSSQAFTSLVNFGFALVALVYSWLSEENGLQAPGSGWEVYYEDSPGEGEEDVRRTGGSTD